MKLALSLICTNGGTQARAATDPDTVASYADDMRADSQFPPVIAFFDGADYWLADGFHRVAAANENGTTEINADVRQGTRRDAVLFAAGANTTNGLRRTNSDKRRAVETLLCDPEWAQWSDREIARRAGVSDRLVNNIRAELTANGSQSPTMRLGADGRTINVANIGKGQPDLTEDEARALLTQCEAQIQSAIDNVANMGRAAAEIKAMLDDEQFQSWAKAEFNWDPGTAEKLIAFALRRADNPGYSDGALTLMCELSEVALAEMQAVFSIGGDE